MSPKSPTQILSIKGECTFLFSNFLIIGFCSPSANTFLYIISFLTVPLEIELSTSETVFYQKIINH